MLQQDWVQRSNLPLADDFAQFFGACMEGAKAYISKAGRRQALLLRLKLVSAAHVISGL